MGLGPTKKQKEEFSACVKKYTEICMSTHDTNFNDSEFKRKVDLFYTEVGFEPPKKIIRVESPLAGMMLAHKIRQVDKSIDSSMDIALQTFMSDRVRQISEEDYRIYYDNVYLPLSKIAYDQLYQQVLNQVSDMYDGPTNYYYGSFQVAMLAFHSIIADLTKETNSINYDVFVDLSVSTGWFWCFEDTFVASDKPTYIQMGNKEIFPEKKSIEYDDDFGVYLINKLRFSSLEIGCIKNISTNGHLFIKVMRSKIIDLVGEGQLDGLKNFLTTLSSLESDAKNALSLSDLITCKTIRSFLEKEAVSFFGKNWRDR